ncbi:hypothetical protein OIU34_00525 [Pararhizobium sp. BT-229]|uniref:hypothetical protein n=1 Tax=Pararhizobium sp. BT-229 TaxID=2986923 RepID=UPI0021F6BBE4|nr:hypothetical protein [Pararhizobium sp. BT-229]MCV9960370.1 hypothetical protein [Pararhizobium sp. BT-229]
MEKLADLPPTALVTFGAVLALIFGIRYLGLFQGQTASRDKDAAAAQVAAVIVDPTALNRATAALEAQTLEALNHRKMMERSTEEVVEVLQELTRAVEKLREEMIRKGR